MKIANFVNDGRIGGPQKRIVQIAGKLSSQGIETIMFFPFMGDELVKYLEDNRVAFVNVSLSRPRIQHPVRSMFRLFFSFPIEVVQIFRALRHHSIDVVHVNGPFTLQPLFAAKLARLPAIWHLNDTTLSSSVYVFLKRAFGWLATIRAYSSSRVISHYRDGSNRNIALLYPPVDLNKFRSAQYVGNRENESGDKADTIELITVGNVNPSKGYIYLIRALASLRHLPCKWRLSIVGAVLDTNREYYDNLTSEIERNELAERVVFTGPRNDIPELLAKSDLFILSSTCEAGPMVLIEAMASGLPCIATDVGFVNEVIIEKENGIIVPPGNAEALADAIKALLLDSDTRKLFAKNARNSLDEKFSVDKVSEETMNLYKKIAKARSTN